MSLLLAVAGLPTTRAGRSAMAVVWGTTIVLAEPSNSRSLVVMAPLGIVVLL